MTKALILAASLGLSVSAANACDYLKSADSAAVDKTAVVASISEDQAVPMSVPGDQIVLPLPSQADTGQPTQ
ncbi:hypothetical protein ASD64_02125 [Mesorhizobium sp. Root157]|uniref:hypothetical protein n=1 Tax=Mesorhizobium sp. Root157 TaxID=1736477 RepID=UPI0006F8E592|nr:hypothetical protein [Mesorhizobium sp. Root157]KRA00384.1 hypothetical protein ASD64_02125 [Mesorhizobium sp. Root157]